MKPSFKIHFKKLSSIVVAFSELLRLTTKLCEKPFPFLQRTYRNEKISYFRNFIYIDLALNIHPLRIALTASINYKFNAKKEIITRKMTLKKLYPLSKKKTKPSTFLRYIHKPLFFRLCSLTLFSKKFSPLN